MYPPDRQRSRIDDVRLSGTQRFRSRLRGRVMSFAWKRNQRNELTERRMVQAGCIRDMQHIRNGPPPERPPSQDAQPKVDQAAANRRYKEKGGFGLCDSTHHAHAETGGDEGCRRCQLREMGVCRSRQAKQVTLSSRCCSIRGCTWTTWHRENEGTAAGGVVPGRGCRWGERDQLECID